jgi:hypothetical protein
MAEITRDLVTTLVACERAQLEPDQWIIGLAQSWLERDQAARDAEAKLAAVAKFAQDCHTEVERRQAMKMHGPHLDAAQVAQRLDDLVGGDQEQPKPEPVCDKCHKGMTYRLEDGRESCWCGALKEPKPVDAIVGAPAAAAVEDVTPPWHGPHHAELGGVK